MIEEIAELRLAQEDGGLPTIFAAGGAPGESGVIVVTARFRGGMHISANPRRHHICVFAQNTACPVFWRYRVASDQTVDQGASNLIPEERSGGVTASVLARQLSSKIKKCLVVARQALNELRFNRGVFGSRECELARVDCD